MDRLRLAELDLHMEHRHGDGSWAALERRPDHHDPSDHDPERDWARGAVYVCTTCDEEVRVTPSEGIEAPPV
jgi:hypothetical protein